MSPTAKDLFAHAMNLPDNERAALAAWLIDSLDAQQEAAAQTAWQAEVSRRLSELDNGTVVPVPWAQARQMIVGTADGPAEG